MDITSHSLVATVALFLSGRRRRQVYLEKQSWIERIYFWPSYSSNGPIRSRLHKLSHPLKGGVKSGVRAGCGFMENRPNFQD